MLLTIIAFILILGFLVLVHELGHFLVAKRFGTGVEEFGMGFPPKIISKKVGETEYSLNLIPIGGFVRIKGEDNDSALALDPDSFAAKPAWQRALILVAGVTMNIIAGWLLLVLLYAVGIPTEITDDVPRSYILSSNVVVSEVLSNSPAEQVGIMSGDEIVSINGEAIATASAMQQAVAEDSDGTVAVLYRRNNATTEALINPQILEQYGVSTPIIGVGLIETGVVRYPPHLAVLRGTQATGSFLRRIVVAFADIIQRAVQREPVGDSLGGPVAIAVATNDVLDLGWRYVLLFTALLAFNLAIINIFPFPALDGGRLVFLVAEKIRGKPSRQAVEGWFHRIGFTLLILLAIVVTYRDIMRFGSRIWNAFVG